MLEYLSGQISSLTPTTAVIDCGGIGYLLNISLTSFTAIQDKETVRLLVHEVIREDQWQLYGFATENERELFRALIGVSGVGPAMARMLLSSLSPAELEDAITHSDHRVLKAVKGVGAKTAERIIVDLRDKIKPGENSQDPVNLPSSGAYDEALAAMVMLGFNRQPSQQALKKIFEEQPLISVEKAIKQALAIIR